MQIPFPPFALEPASFRFPALAALAARSALGAGREATLSVLLVARIAESAVAGGVPRALRAGRGAAAVQWLNTSCPDPKIRAACLAVVESANDDAREPLAKALTRVLDANSSHLDGASKAELATLVRTVTG
jgi:hypothetical protein